jgi:hypothetical protein
VNLAAGNAVVRCSTIDLTPTNSGRENHTYSKQGHVSRLAKMLCKALVELGKRVEVGAHLPSCGELSFAKCSLLDDYHP